MKETRITRDSSPQGRRRSRFGISILVIFKAVSCAVLLTVLAQTLHLYTESNARHALLDEWEITRGFAVFYPHYIGDDLEEFEQGGHDTPIAIADELYTLLDEDGAIFIDASNYQPGVPEFPWLPVAPIRVNANYLDAFSIEAEDGTRVVVNAEEQAWTVLVPASYRKFETEITRYFLATRVGDGELDGAVQGQQRMLRLPVPDRFDEQAVRIIWTRTGQDVFSFNSDVSIDRGNMVEDPIIEVMTPANSLIIDRLNSITGEINTPLKVRIEGDIRSVMQGLRPTLHDLALDDNLVNLVNANDSVLIELEEIRSATAWAAGVAALALLFMLLFSALLIASISDRSRRTFMVRRLHGFGILRTHRESGQIMAIAWVAQVLLSILVIVAWRNSFQSSVSEQLHVLDEIALVIMLALPVFIVDVVLSLGTAIVLERRDGVKRLKEL